MADTSSRTNANSSTPIFSTLANDFRTIRADIERRGIKRVFSGTLESVEAFYLTEEDRKRLGEMPRIGHYLHRAWWLLKSLLLKLTPARRFMLALAIWFLVLGPDRLHIGKATISFRMPWLGVTILLVLLMLELRDKLVARDELESGRLVQLALLPREDPQIPGWDVSLYTRPANDVGGDLVDHLQLDDQHHFVTLGDVAGKALPAALLSVKLQATLRALGPHFENLGDLGDAVNRLLHRDGLPTRFASLVYLALTPDSGHVRVLNAGHMPPLIVHGGAITSMERGAMVLGIMPDAKFSEQTVDLSPGDTLVVYSDGVSEAMNEGDDFFGDDRLFSAVRDTCQLSARQMSAGILKAVQRFTGDAVPNDDVSLVVLRRQ